METSALAALCVVAGVSLFGGWIAAGVVQIDAHEIGQGRDYFVMSCAECHGDDGKGDEGPDLRHLAANDVHIKDTIKHGIKDQMPSFSKKYNDAQISAIVAYVRSLK